MPNNLEKILSSVTSKPYHSTADFILYHADCLALLDQMPTNSVDMIFADPPYNLSNGGFTCQNGRAVSVNKADWDKSDGLEQDFRFHLTWVQACRRVLKPHGTLWVSGTYHSIYQCGYAMQRSGFHILNDIAWYKPNAAPNLSCRYFTASHETLIWARKEKKAKHTFSYDAMRNWKDNYRMQCEHGQKMEVLHKQGKQMRSVWAISTPKKAEKRFGKHPTQKPLALLQRVVVASTKPGEVILDPFTGSSTTGLAAVRHGRRFIGLDSEAKYLKLSVNRYKEHVQSK